LIGVGWIIAGAALNSQPAAKTQLKDAYVG
jgi:hypothetical protein